MSSATLDNLAATSASSKEDADEILSRLAGEEIDRLVESEGISPATADDAHPTPDLGLNVGDVDTELAAQAETQPPTATLAESSAESSAELATTDEVALAAEVMESVLRDVEPAPADPLSAETPEPATADTPASELTSASDALTEPLAESLKDALAEEPSTESALATEAADEFQTPVAETPIAETPALEQPAVPTHDSEAPGTPSAVDNSVPLLNESSAPKRKGPPHVGPPFVTASEKWKPPIDANVLADLPDLMPDWQARLLAPLILLNKPFEKLSPQTRKTLGLLALLTLFNSAVTIVWALFFKH